MKTLLHLARIAFLAIVAAAISSCGSDSGSDEPSHPPSISNLAYSPSTAYQVSGGTVAINGAVDFTDAGGDVVSLRLVTSSGEDLTVPTPALSGVTSGTATGTLIVSVDKVGQYTFEVWLVDGRGSVSNRLGGTFEVLPAEPTVHPPSITSLRYSPASALQSAGGAAAISAEVDFSDAGGDVASFRVVSSAGTDLTIPTSNLSGVKTGTATASFALPIDTAGAITFEVWVTDGRGSDSNRLSGTFQVLPQDTTGAWEKLGVSPPNRLYGIAWNGSRYVVVGANGTVMSSTNLTDWSVHATGVNHTLRSVASSATRFVAVGENAVGQAIVLASADGTTWSVEHTLGACQATSCGTPSQLSKVIWTGTQFVAVGQELVGTGTLRVYVLVLTSPDGLTWTQRADKAMDLGLLEYIPSYRHVTSVAWSGTVYALLAADAESGFGVAGPLVWVSPDGDQWTQSSPLPNDAVTNSPLRDITWGNGRFVAVGVAGMSGGAPAFVSADGVDWQVDATVTDLPAMNAVTTGANEYLAVGDDHRQLSSDGLLWTATPMTDCGNGIVWDGSRYVAVGAAICRSQ